MPEIVSKYPEVVLKVLKDAKINCGGDNKPTILIHCPKDKFCSLPTGELCVYGVKEIPQMTQLHTTDMFPISSIAVFFSLVFVVAFLLGMLIGWKSK